jgi:3-oxoacyl-[acyl-carrier protein] reductase
MQHTPLFQIVKRSIFNLFKQESRKRMITSKLQLDLEGRLAVVTGATGQLGRVMARTLAACGADVVVHYHQNAAKATELCAEISALGRRTVAVTGDVGQKTDVFALRDRVLKQLGAPDIIVTNAVSQIHPWQTVLEE